MSILIHEFCQQLNTITELGDIVEFGTGGGTSTNTIASLVDKKRNIYTFDGFQGLPKTNKGVPKGTGWEEGNLFFNENLVRNFLQNHKNVFIEKCMTWELKEPRDYGINKIIGANMDLDLYEGTLDGLRFLDKCEWESILIRFDDWGNYPHQIASEVDAHEKAAFFDWIGENEYQYMINMELTNRSQGLQTIIKVSR